MSIIFCWWSSGDTQEQQDRDRATLTLVCARHTTKQLKEALARCPDKDKKEIITEIVCQREKHEEEEQLRDDRYNLSSLSYDRQGLQGCGPGGRPRRESTVS